MKDGYRCKLSNVDVFNRVDHITLRGLYNQSKMLICTSKMETLHLAGMEAAACNIPLLTTNVGAYYNLENGIWGRHINNINNDVDYILNNLDSFNSRNYFEKTMSKEQCKNSWRKLI